MSLTPATRMRPHSCTTCLLNRAFCDFGDELRAAFDNLKRTVTFRRGEAIFDQGSRPHSVFAVCEGGVKLVTASSEGRVLLLRLVHRGEILGLAEAVLGTQYEYSCVPTREAVLAVIPVETFLRFISSYPQARAALNVALSQQYKLAQRETKFLAFGETSTVRLVRLLLDWSSEIGEPAGTSRRIPLQLTHADLAQAIGSTRETVTRVVGSLTREGFIERQPGGIVILRPDALARLGTASAVTHGCDDGASENPDDDLSEGVVTREVRHEAVRDHQHPCSD